MTFRISVESVIFRQFDNMPGEILLVKRAPNCKVAPNVWNVPAGKVNLLETTSQAVIRETLEETRLNVKVEKLLAESAFEIISDTETTYRNMFTYLTYPLSHAEIHLNDEHSEYKWATLEEMSSNKYSSLMPRLKTMILEVFKSHE